MNDEEYYNALNNQYNTQYSLFFNRRQAIETKAINLMAFSGIVLGLKYTILYNFYPNILIGNMNFLYDLIAISSSFLFISILLGIATIFESHSFYASGILSSKESLTKKDFIAKSAYEMKCCLLEKEDIIKSKERFLKFSIISFLIGIFGTIFLFGYTIRYSFYM